MEWGIGIRIVIAESWGGVRGSRDWLMAVVWIWNCVRIPCFAQS